MGEQVSDRESRAAAKRVKGERKERMEGKGWVDGGQERRREQGG